MSQIKLWDVVVRCIRYGTSWAERNLRVEASDPDEAKTRAEQEMRRRGYQDVETLSTKEYKRARVFIPSGRHKDA